MLIEQGLLRGSSAALQGADIGALFMPHGLGHLLGIDTHDVGGYGNGLPPRSNLPGLKSLRLGRWFLLDSHIIFSNTNLLLLK